MRKVRKDTKLIRQARKLYTLGLTMEKRRDALQRLVERGVPYNSPKMKAALEEFQAAEYEWKRLEQEHLRYRSQLGAEIKDMPKSAEE